MPNTSFLSFLNQKQSLEMLDAISEIFNTINIIKSHKELFWIAKMLFIILSALILGIFADYLLNRISNKLEKTRHNWDDLLAQSARKPLKILIWILGIALAVKTTGSQIKSDFREAAIIMKNLGIALCIGWLLLGFIKKYEFRAIIRGRGKKFDVSTVVAIAKLIKAIIIITTSLMVLQTLGFNISGILALGGVGGIAIGFASKDLLANFFGAILLYFDRPFSIDDWIRSPDRDIEGTVEYIGWRITHIRTFDQRMLYIPNSIFSSIAIENASRMTNRRIFENIGLRYDDMNKVAKIVEETKEMLIKHEEIDQSQALMVNLDKFDSYSINFFIYTFTRTTDWDKFNNIKQDILLKINNIVEKNGGEIAFPTSIVNIDGKLQINAIEEMAKNNLLTKNK